LNYVCNEALLVVHVLEELGITATITALADAKSVVDLLCKSGQRSEIWNLRRRKEAPALNQTATS